MMIFFSESLVDSLENDTCDDDKKLIDSVYEDRRRGLLNALPT